MQLAYEKHGAHIIKLKQQLLWFGILMLFQLGKAQYVSLVEHEKVLIVSLY